jgi:hypothetical protein
MRERILGFVQALRGRGVEASLAETLDAVAAVAAAGVERERLREALAATLVKDEADRPVFDALFEELFPGLTGKHADARRRRGEPRGRGIAGARGQGEGGGMRAARTREEPSMPSAAASARPSSRAQESPQDAHTAVAKDRDESGDHAALGRAARRQELLARPFVDLTSRDVAEARDLVRELGARLRGRLARRARRARRGRLDFRRTIRAAMGTGGVPVRPRFRIRRPGRPDLLALCDVSGSVAAASELLLGLLAPAAAYFRRVSTFVYVDRLCPVSIEGGHVAPGGELDLHARSDFGRVLVDLWREAPRLLSSTTLVLVLGDGRNNRRPPRPDLLRAARDRVQRLVWLVPEPAVRWNTGDSVLDLYAPACDALFECVNLGDLVRAVRRSI